MIQAVVLPDGGVITSQQEAVIGLLFNKEKERILRDHVYRAKQDVVELVHKFAECYTTKLDKDHTNYMPLSELADREPHLVANGIGKTYVQRLYDSHAHKEQGWAVWRNDCPEEERQVFGSLKEAARTSNGLLHLVAKDDIQEHLETQALRAIIDELQAELEIRLQRKNKEE